MTTEELELVRAKLKRADEIVSTLDVLKAASRAEHGTATVRFNTWSTNEEIIENGLLRDVIELGRVTMIEELEAELATISLNESPVAAPMPLSPLGTYFKPGIMSSEPPDPGITRYEVTCGAKP